jgi:hypothetical protein
LSYNTNRRPQIMPLRIKAIVEKLRAREVKVGAACVESNA